MGNAGGFGSGLPKCLQFGGLGKLVWVSGKWCLVIWIFLAGEDGCGGGCIARSLEVHRSLLPQEEVISSACLSRQGKDVCSVSPG